MKIFRISQTVNSGYDTHDAAIVCANDEAEARMMNPTYFDGWDDYSSTWCPSPDDVKVEYIGEAAEGVEHGFILKSFNAG